MSKASGLRLKEGLEVQIQGLEALQRLHRATALIPGIPESPEVVMRRIQFQNPTLRTGGWKHYVAKERSRPAGAGWILIVRIPEGSIRALRDLDLRLYLETERDTIRMTQHGPEREPEANGNVSA